MCIDESDGRSRGLVLFWNKDNKMIIEYVSCNCISLRHGRRLRALQSALKSQKNVFKSF
jgi:hypothetical protein